VRRKVARNRAESGQKPGRKWQEIGQNFALPSHLHDVAGLLPLCAQQAGLVG
jgi:hypothetical protein